MTTATVEARSSAPWHLWLVGVVAVLWNAYGCYDYLMSQTKGDAYLRAAGMTDAQIAYFHAMPAWMTGVWAIGVWGGMLGAILLLLRSRHAVVVFAVSLAAFLLSVAWSFGVGGAAQVLGAKAMVMDAVIAAACVFFLLYARAMAKAGALR